jgi:hypothetical protein
VERDACNQKQRVTGVCKPQSGLPLLADSFLLVLLGSRCMLKRFHIELEHGFAGMFIPTADMGAPFSDFVSFISALNPVELKSYFLKFVSVNTVAGPNPSRCHVYPLFSHCDDLRRVDEERSLDSVPG